MYIRKFFVLLMCGVFLCPGVMQAQATIDASNPDALMQALAEQIHSGLLTREEAKALLNDLSIEFDIDGTMIGVESLLTNMTTPLPEAEQSVSPVVAPPETVSASPLQCFDYYHFGSVDVQLFNRSATALPGVPLSVNVELTNRNPYPLIDGQLYIKVFRAQEDNISTQINGDAVVDSFFALEELTLATEEIQQTSFTWTPSQYLPAGNYYFAAYFVTAKRFNLAGLSFTDDIIGGRGDFTVVSEEPALYFDKDSVTINDAPYQFIAAAPKIDNLEPVNLAAEVVNQAEEDRTVIVNWKIYSWDALRDEKLIEQKEEAVVVPAGSSAKVTYQVANTHNAVYLVVPSLSYNNALLSQLNVRFARAQIDAPRLNFPSVSKYPLKAGEAVTLFSCLHNAGTNVMVADTSLILKIQDETGTVVHEYAYHGPTTGQMMAAGETFIPDRDLSTFSLTATLAQGDRVVDEVSVVYDCNAIDPTVCQSVSASPAADLESDQNNLKWFLGVGAMLIFMLCIGIGFLLRQLRQKPAQEFTTGSFRSDN